MQKPKYLLVVYVPTASAASLKQALFNAGAGAIGAYHSCAWQTLGMGQFVATNQANPTIGETNQVTYVPEMRIEMVLMGAIKNTVEQTLLNHHPYETPAYYFQPLI